MARPSRTAIPGDAGVDVNTLCLAVAFNWLVLGTDAHAKNSSLLLSGSQVRLAPLYDIASLTPYDVHPRKLKLAQKVGGGYRPTVIEGRHWDRLARDVRIDPGQLRAGIVDMIDRLPDAMSDAVAASDLTGHESTSAGHLIESITGWLRHCRPAMGAGSG